MEKRLFSATPLALALAACLALFVQCGSGSSALVGRWVGSSNPGKIPDSMELLKDGSGIADGKAGINWKVEGDRLYIFSMGYGEGARAFDYSISGTTLTLTHDNQMYMFAKQKK